MLDDDEVEEQVKSSIRVDMSSKKDSFLEKNRYYGFFSNHGFNSGMIQSPPQLGKHTSSGIDERIFNGVFYNLDNQY